MGSIKDLENSWKVCQGVLYLQRKTRLIAGELGAASGQAGAGLSIAEGLLLHILEAQHDRTVKDLADILALERSWVSRLVSELEKRKLLQCKESDLDKRAKHVNITAKGKEALVSLNSFRYQVMQHAVDDLSKESQKELAELIRKVADGLKAHKFIVTPHSHKIDAELARLSWAIGVMGENFLKSGMGVAQFHIYEVIANSNNNTMLASDVNDLLPFDMSTITRSIVNFEKTGHITRQVSKEDRRSFFVSLSRKGQEKWKQMKDAAADLFNQINQSMSASEVKNVIDLLFEVSKNMPIARTNSLVKNIEIKRINNSDMLKEAKNFSQQSFFTAASLEEDTNKTSNKSSYLLYSGHSICGIASIEHKGKKSKDDKFTIALSGLSDEECNDFLKQLNRWRKRSSR